MKKLLFFLLPLLMVALLAGCAKEPSEESGYADINTARYGVLSGTTNEAFVRAHYPNATIYDYPKLTDCYMALDGGKVDYVVTAYSNAFFALKTFKNLTIVDDNVEVESRGIAVSKSKPELTQRINQVIERFQKDGSLEEMKRHWFDNEPYVMVDIPKASGSNGVLKVAISAEREPICFVSNGEYRGMDIELIKRIAYELDMGIEFQNMDFSAMIASISSGKSDVAISNITITDERKKAVDFSISYFEHPVVRIARARGADADAQKTSGISSFKESFRRNFIDENRWEMVLSGLWVTVLISVLSAIFGTAIGFGLCMLRRMRNKVGSTMAAVFIRIVQGLPIVVLLMILYYIIFAKSEISAIIVAVIGFSINFGAYVSEMMRTGIDAVDKGQIEAANAMGFNRVRTFVRITMPQAARHFIPVFKGEFISMVKMTSVVGYIAIQDLTKVSDIIRSRTYEAFFPLISTAVIYFLIAYFFIFLIGRLELGLDPKRRPRRLKKVVTE